MNILLFADKFGLHSELRQFLEVRGGRCSFANSSGEALALFGSGSFDLILELNTLRRRVMRSSLCELGTATVTSFSRYPVEQGCWWLPVIREGRVCLGKAALRHNAFMELLDTTLQRGRIKPTSSLIPNFDVVIAKR